MVWVARFAVAGPCSAGCKVVCWSPVKSGLEIPCTSLGPFCGFSPFWFFVESASYVLSIVVGSSTSTPGTLSDRFMRRLPLFILVAFNIIAAADPSSEGIPRASAPSSAEGETSYLGADLNTYPGDNALPLLRQNFSFAGYWLSPPPGAKENTWVGKREMLRSQGFGFAVLYAGPQSSALKSEARAKQKGMNDAKRSAAAAAKERFPPHTVIFLDIEEGGRLSKMYHAYLRAWIDELMREGYRAGVYCSGMPVREAGGVTIVTADDIRNNVGSREMAYWVYNDACPPSPGCAVPHAPRPPLASGVPYAAVWQFAQSPRRREFTERCAATYQPDGNCYAPGDTAHAWFLDVNAATSRDPSGGGK